METGVNVKIVGGTRSEESAVPTISPYIFNLDPAFSVVLIHCITALREVPNRAWLTHVHVAEFSSGVICSWRTPTSTPAAASCFEYSTNNGCVVWTGGAEGGGWWGWGESGCSGESLGESLLAGQ